jgi:drug/metabolite transporter (DMT)-like permease
MTHETRGTDMPILAVLFTVFLCILFGANTVALKISLSGIGPFTNAGLRFAVAALVICLWARATGRSFGLKKGQVRHVWVLSAIFIIQLSLFYLGINRTHASRGVLVSNLVPFFVLLLAHFVIPGDRMNAKKVLGIFLGACGVIFIFMEQKGMTADFRGGDLIVLAAAVFWACNSVYTKRIIEDFDPFHLVLYPMVISIPFFFIAGFWMDDMMLFPLSTPVWVALGFQALITASFGFVAWNTMLQKYGAVALHSFIFIMPLAGVVLGGWMLGEPITRHMVFALILITSGIAVVHIHPKKLASFLRPGRGYQG